MRSHNFQSHSIKSGSALNLFNDTRVRGMDDEGPARRNATRHDRFVIWSSLFEQRWSISRGRGDHGAGGDEERESVVDGADFGFEAGGKFGMEEMSELQQAREFDMVRRDGWSGMNPF